MAETFDTDVSVDRANEEGGQDALVSLASLVETEGRNWAIRPEILAGLSRLRSSAHALDEVESFMSSETEAKRRTPAQVKSRGDVAVLSLKGVLMPNVSFIAMIFGLGSGLARFRDGLKQAVGDDDIGAIVLDIDSPGGLVDQIPEVAAEIRAAREVKPIVAVANTLAASAAYWLAAQADEVVITPSGEVGSIGVYAEHRDISVALETAGIKPTLISAGKYKVEGNPYQPLDEAAEAAIQEGVDYCYGLFVSDVAKGRDDSVSKVKSGYGEGRVLNPKRAVEENMADRIDTLDATIARLMGRQGGGTSRRSEAAPPELRSGGAQSPESSDEAAAVMGSVFDAFFGKDEKEVVH